MDQCCAYSSDLRGSSWSTLYCLEIPCGNEQILREKILTDIYLQLQEIFAAQLSVLNGVSIMESTHNWVILWNNCWDRLEEGCSGESESSDLIRRILITFGKSVNKLLGSFSNAILAADIYEDEDYCSSFRQFIFDQELNGDDIASQLYLYANKLLKEGGEMTAPLSSLLELQAKVLVLFLNFDQCIFSTVSLSNRILKAKKSISTVNNQSMQTNDGKKLFISVMENLIFVDRKQLLGRIKEVQELCDNMINTKKGFVEDGLSNSTVALHKPCLARLHMVGPLRKVERTSFSESLKDMQRICNDLLVVFAATELLPDHLEIIVNARDVHASVPPHNLSWEQVFQLFVDLSKQRLHLIARSWCIAVQSVISLDLNTYLVNSMRHRGIPNSILFVQTVIDEWIAGNPCLAAWEVMRSTSVCRSRIISRMENILSLWGHVATEAMYVDDRIRLELTLPAEQQHKWLSAWAIVMTTKFMDIYMELLMDMDVLDKTEFDSFYWYWDYILTTQGHAIDRLRSLNYQLEMTLYEEKQAEYNSNIMNSKKNGKKNKMKMIEPVPPKVIPAYAEDFLNRGKGQLCRGLFRITLILKQLGFLKRHDSMHTSTGFIFDRRFRIFQEVINPTALTYGEFVYTINKDKPNGNELEYSYTEEANVLPIDDVAVVLQSAFTCFQNARKFFEEAKKSTPMTIDARCFSATVTGLMKVSVGSILHATKLMKLLTPDGKLISVDVKVTQNLSYDCRFPVFEIQ